MGTRSKWMPDGEADTPYMRARQEWDARMGSVVVQAKNWRQATFASLGLVLVALVGAVYLGAQPKVIPHVIEVDQLGNAVYRGPVGQTAAHYSPSEATLRYHLRRFIDDTRTISGDPVVLKRNWLDAYAMVTRNGGNMLTAFVQKPENEPFRRSQEERVSVEVFSLVAVSADTWQIDWKEKRWDKNGNAMGDVVWRGMLRVVIQVPKSEEAMVRNPIGIYVDEFHWDKVTPS
jgi:type IV secretory pathway TrbF-like protein